MPQSVDWIRFRSLATDDDGVGELVDFYVTYTAEQRAASAAPHVRNLKGRDRIIMSVTESTKDPEVVHRLKNYICIISGFCELLISDCAEDDPRRADLMEIHKAAQHAIAMMPEVSERIRREV